jgi:spore germination protein GerM
VSLAGRARRRIGLLALLTGLAGVMGGCGLTTNDEPEPLAREDVPDDLLDPAGAGSQPEPTVVGEEVTTASATVYFLRGDDSGAFALVPANRQVASPVTAARRLEALIQMPPNQLERDGGIATRVPEAARVVGRPQVTEAGVLQVNLSENFYDLQGEASRLAFAQVVFTATEIDGVSSVRFLVNDRPAGVVDGDGQSRDGPVDRTAYRSLQPDE